MKRWAKITLGTVVGFVVVGGIGNAIDPTPAPVTTAADSTTTDVPPPAPTTTPSPAPAPEVRATAAVAPAPVADPQPAAPIAAPPPAGVPDWERYCKVTDTVWDGVFWLKVDSGAAYNFSICDETKAQVVTNTDIDQLLAQPGMDRRCLSDQPYHEANVGVYADTTKGDLAAAKQFCQAHGWSNF